jgi:hypothetical protein
MLLGEVFHTTGNDARHRFVAIAHQYFFTVTNHLDVSTKPSFQVTDVNGFHIAIIADVTMLVILTPCLLHRIGVEIAFSPFLPYICSPSPQPTIWLCSPSLAFQLLRIKDFLALFRNNVSSQPDSDELRPAKAELRGFALDLRIIRRSSFGNLAAALFPHTLGEWESASLRTIMLYDCHTVISII